MSEWGPDTYYKKAVRKFPMQQLKQKKAKKSVKRLFMVCVAFFKSCFANSFI